MASNQKVSLTTATALVIANMVGTGVFTSIGFQAADIPDANAILIVWILGSIVALCGGICYSKVAELYPGYGGEYHFLTKAWNPTLGLIGGIVSIISGFAAPVALAALAFGAYFSIFFKTANGNITAIAIISIITIFHLFSIKTSSKFQLVTTTFKIVLILLFILVGFWAKDSGNNFNNDLPSIDLFFTEGFSRSLVYVAFAFSGWNASVYIFNELKKPGTDIKLSILAGTLIVGCLYLLLNYVFLKVVALKKLQGVLEASELAASQLFGKSGGEIISIIICVLLLSTISAMVWVGPRVIERMGNDVRLLKWFDHKDEERIPYRAILLQYAITIIILFSGTFNFILVNTGILLNLSTMLTVAILFKHPLSLDKKTYFAAILFLLVTSSSTFYLLWKVLV